MIVSMNSEFEYLLSQLSKVEEQVDLLDDIEGVLSPQQEEEVLSPDTMPPAPVFTKVETTALLSIELQSETLQDIEEPGQDVNLELHRPADNEQAVKVEDSR